MLITVSRITLVFFGLSHARVRDGPCVPDVRNGPVRVRLFTTVNEITVIRCAQKKTRGSFASPGHAHTSRDEREATPPVRGTYRVYEETVRGGGITRVSGGSEETVLYLRRRREYDNVMT